MAQAIGVSLLPHLATQATTRRYARMQQTTLKVMGAAIVLAVPSAILLWLLGKPIIRLIFQHGAFTAHASMLTYLALIGYAIGLPGIIAGELLTGGFFALKDTRTPLVTNTLALAARFGLIVLLLRMLHGTSIILSIPLSLSGAATGEAVLLCTILLLRLHNKVKQDQGIVRLQRRREYIVARQKQLSRDMLIEKQMVN